MRQYIGRSCSYKGTVQRNGQVCNVSFDGTISDVIQYQGKVHRLIIQGTDGRFYECLPRFVKIG